MALQGDTAEAVAYTLLHEIAEAEGKSLFHGETNAVDRRWILDTYAECLEATKRNRTVKRGD